MSMINEEENLKSAQIKYGDSDVASKRRKSDYDIFVQEALADVLNSTAIENEDFKGGSVLSSATDNSAKIYISKKPSDSSKGFENTFKILEQQIRIRWKNSQAQTFLSKINEEDSFLFPEQLSERSQPSSPDMLELQLEALQRFKTLMKGKDRDEITSPDEELSQQSFTADETILEQSGNSSNCEYHISKGKDGQNRLRVIRNTLFDKGM